MVEVELTELYEYEKESCYNVNSRHTKQFRKKRHSK